MGSRMKVDQPGRDFERCPYLQLQKNQTKKDEKVAKRLLYEKSEET
jgi:hypothetical protein